MSSYSIELHPQEIKTVSKILQDVLNPRELMNTLENLSRMEELDVRYASERFLLALDDLDEIDKDEEKQ